MTFPVGDVEQRRYYRRYVLPEEADACMAKMTELANDPSVVSETMRYPAPHDPGILFVHLFWVQMLPARRTPRPGGP